MPNNLFSFSLVVFTGFFAIMNPVANIPVFIGLAGDEDQQTQRKIARISTITAFFIVTSFVIFGNYIFQLFNITIPAFKISGGILVFYVGFEMLSSQKSKLHHQNVESLDNENLAVSPLAIPILAGPGTIVTAMNFVTHTDTVHIALVIAIFGLIAFLTYLAFLLSEPLVRLMGNNIITVIAKIMGLIIAIIGTDMVMEGIKLGFKVQ